MGLYILGYIGMMEKKMETTGGSVWILLSLYWVFGSIKSEVFTAEGAAGLVALGFGVRHFSGVHLPSTARPLNSQSQSSNPEIIIPEPSLSNETA